MGNTVTVYEGLFLDMWKTSYGSNYIIKIQLNYYGICKLQLLGNNPNYNKICNMLKVNNYYRFIVNADYNPHLNTTNLLDVKDKLSYISNIKIIKFDNFNAFTSNIIGPNCQQIIYSYNDKNKFEPIYDDEYKLNGYNQNNKNIRLIIDNKIIKNMDIGQNYNVTFTKHFYDNLYYVVDYKRIQCRLEDTYDTL